MSDDKVIIIAEAGVNHNGSYDRAVEMVRQAKLAGADFVKFQTGTASKFISTCAQQADYQRKNTGKNESQLEMVDKLMLPMQDYARLAQVCDQEGIGFMSTAFDLDSIDLLAQIGQQYWKIPSGEITNLPYLRKIGLQKGKIIMSTGMSTLEEVEAAVKATERQREDIILLHCTTQYPAPMESVNLRAMLTLKELGCAEVGYSDHTAGITIPIAAVVMGAKVIEKHFTLDRSLPGPDHKASLEPAELKAMVAAIRDVERAFGTGEKKVTDAECANIAVARKSIVALRPIKKGQLITEADITCKRPGTGISPMLWDEVIGQEAKRDFEVEALIEL